MEKCQICSKECETYPDSIYEEDDIEFYVNKPLCEECGAEIRLEYRTEDEEEATTDMREENKTYKDY